MLKNILHHIKINYINQAGTSCIGYALTCLLTGCSKTSCQLSNWDSVKAFSYKALHLDQVACPKTPYKIGRLLAQLQQLDDLHPDDAQKDFATAIKAGYNDIVMLMLQHKNIDVNNVQYGLTALLLALRYDQEKTAQFMLDHLPNYKPLHIMAKDQTGSTALHWAIKNKCNKLVSTIIDKITTWEDLCSKDGKGRTPLHLAARYQNQEAFIALLHKMSIDKRKLINQLVFETDKCACSVFAYGYLSKGFIKLRHNVTASNAMFEFMLQASHDYLSPLHYAYMLHELDAISNAPFVPGHLEADAVYQIIKAYHPITTMLPINQLRELLNNHQEVADILAKMPIHKEHSIVDIIVKVNQALLITTKDKFKWQSQCKWPTTPPPPIPTISATTRKRPLATQYSIPEKKCKRPTTPPPPIPTISAATRKRPLATQYSIPEKKCKRPTTPPPPIPMSRVALLKSKFTALG